MRERQRVNRSKAIYYILGTVLLVFGTAFTLFQLPVLIDTPDNIWIVIATAGGGMVMISGGIFAALARQKYVRERELDRAIEANRQASLANNGDEASDEDS